MKKIGVLIALLGVSAMALTACGKNEADMKYLSDFKASKYVKLGDYKGLSVDVEKTEVTDAEIEDYVSYILDYYAETSEIVDRTDVRDGDIANIDYEGKKDGVAFDGGSDQGYDLAIGSGTFIPGFESGLIGANVGDTVDLELTFPESYGNTDLAGQDVVFTVKINSIKKEVIPTLTDDFVKGLEDENFNDVASFKEYLRNDLETTKTQEREDVLFTKLEEQVLANSEVKGAPSGFVDRIVSTLIDSINEAATEYGADAGTVAYYYYGVDAENYEEGLRTYVSEQMVPEYLVMGAIAEKEGLAVSDAEMDKDIQDMLDEYESEYTLDSYKEMLGDMEAYREYLLVNKVMDFLTENAVINEN